MQAAEVKGMSCALGRQDTPLARRAEAWARGPVWKREAKFRLELLLFPVRVFAY